METDGELTWQAGMLNEVRRAGRAAVAARAAAEACEESVERLGRGGEPPEDVRGILEAILPICDALRRMADAARREEPPETWLARLRSSGRAAAENRTLRDAIVLLDAQLTSALEGRGVAIDREVGGPVDPERHRVVETCARRGGESAGVVSSVVRPGYRVGGARVRDADVVATR